ncbi:MAG: molybdopterin molybdotransferase MoeA [Bacteroidetes bacterium]|jgi:molybdopterin molybdotransferase|nr:molybdopterin molybdotransferase MoeA [Bacteroidota bacterium]
MSLISVEKATAIVLENTLNFGKETVDLKEANNRILKEAVYADRDFPPFDRVSMDGIAIVTDTFKQGQRAFTVENIQAAGSKQLSLINPANCIEVMTGAILPLNTDAVIPYEYVEIENGIATVTIKQLTYFKNIHPKGFDHQNGTLLIDENTLITPAEIGVLASVGKASVVVAKQPRIAIVATGDELVDVDKIPVDYQIRKSNVYTVLGLLNSLRLTAEIFHLKDQQELLRNEISKLLNTFDVLIFSGGVSKGKFDLLPEVFNQLGVQKVFHRVQQRPGKPFWFGRKNSKLVFAFPGNPVATFLNFLKYFKPWYLKSVGLPFNIVNFAILDDDFEFTPNLTYFLQVKVNNSEGQLIAKPIAGKGSADLVNLLYADGFIELSASKSVFKKGEVLPYISFR